MEKIKILHITGDDKFFDVVFAAFESDNRFENKAVMKVVNKNDYRFRRIKNISLVKLVDKKEIRHILQTEIYDVLFFHSIHQEYYRYFHWIPKDKIVIWWCWGFELYQPIYGLPPLIKLPLYKPLTDKLLWRIHGGYVSMLKSILKTCFVAPWHMVSQKRVLKRVDYFQPVIPIEYQLMCEKQELRAREFYYPQCDSLFQINDGLIKIDDGDILFGNSQSPTNNHLDVWESIKPYLPEKRKVFIPINYLGNQKYAGEISKRINSDKHVLCFLKEFLPRDDYFRMIDRCSYAVFGVIRQQAMGNIFNCISSGMKVFLYCDSLIYRYLKKAGFVVFAIEEIDSCSFNRALTKPEIEQNADAFRKLRFYIEDVRQKAFDEILSIIESSK